MFERINVLRRGRRRLATGGSALAMLALLAGCSWVPDSLNPVSWYHDLTDSDAPPSDIAVPRRPDGANPAPSQAQASDAGGLPADRGNARYAESVRRDPAPTKRLVRRVEPAPQQVAEAADATVATVATSPAPAPVQATPLPVPPGAQSATVGAERELPSLDRPMRTARNEGPNAVPAQASDGPPAAANVPDTVPTRRTILSDAYQQRLRESAAATNKTGGVDFSAPARAGAAPVRAAPNYAATSSPVIIGGDGPARPRPALAAASDQPPTVIIGGGGDAAPRLVPPKGLHGTRGMVVPPSAAASFEVASFQPGRLSQADLARLGEVATLQRRSGGTVRLDGGADPALTRRLAAALGEMGVPARKIRIATGDGSADAVRVLMEY